MKKKIGYLLIIALLISCKTEENSTQVLSQKNDDYRISISSIDTKINESGIAQCSKYAKTLINDTTYTSYGLKLKDVIGSALKTTSKYINELPYDSLENEFLDIRIENYATVKVNYDSILLDGVLKAFNLKILPIDSLVSGYTLIVIDEEKLNKSRTECINGTMIKKNEAWNATALRLNILTNIIDQHTKSYVSFDVPSSNCFSFEFIADDDIEKVNEKLVPVGLMFSKALIQQTFYKLETVAYQ